MPAPRIFLTVSAGDLQSVRVTVLETLRAMGCEIVDQEELPLCWTDDELLTSLRECQTLICLVGMQEETRQTNDLGVLALGAQAAWRLAPRDLVAYAVLCAPPLSSDSPSEPGHQAWMAALASQQMDDAPASAEELRRLWHPHYHRVDRVSTEAALIGQMLAYGEQWSALGWEVVNPTLLRTALLGKSAAAPPAALPPVAPPDEVVAPTVLTADEAVPRAPLPPPQQEQQEQQEPAPPDTDAPVQCRIIRRSDGASSAPSAPDDNRTMLCSRGPLVGPGRNQGASDPYEPDLTDLVPKRAASEAEPVPEPSTPEYPPESVQFTVYRPRTITRDMWRAMLVYAHLDDGPDDEPTPLEKVRAEVAHLLGEQARDYADVTKDSRSLIPREAEIQFVPQVPGVRFNPPTRSFFWSEGMDLHKEEFRVRALPETVDGNVTGTLTVYLGVLIVAELPLRFLVTAQGNQTLLASDPSAVSAKPYRNIFPSYSRRDDAIVHQLEAYATTMGDRYLKDVTTLRAGEEWSPRLMELIQGADVFQLFWSERSAQSREVEKEWRQALRQPKPNFIRPTYWEEPMPPAPAEMSHLHFHRLKVPPSQPPPVPAPAQTWTPPVATGRPALRPAVNTQWDQAMVSGPSQMAQPARGWDSDQAMTSATKRPSMAMPSLPTTRAPSMTAPRAKPSPSPASSRRRLPPWVAMLGMVAFLGSMMVMWDSYTRRTVALGALRQSESDARYQREMDELRSGIQRQLNKDRESTTGAQSPSVPGPPALPPPDSRPEPPTMPPSPTRPTSLEVPIRVIVIDPGHGGNQDTGSDREHSKSSSNNAISPKRKLLEKDLTLDLAKRIAACIEQHEEANRLRVRVTLTRDSDINPDFAERATIAADRQAKCFVAIHFNASDNHMATGPRAIVQQRRENPNFNADAEFGEKLAQAVEAASKQFRVATPKASLHDDHELHDGIGSYLFYQLNLHPETRTIPSCHLEVDFIDNVDVESVLLGARRDAVFDTWAEAIANALIAQVQ